VSDLTRRNLTNRDFLVIAHSVGAAWLGLVHEMLQDLCSLLVFIPWTLFLGTGIAAAAWLGEWAASYRFPDTKPQTYGHHDQWHRRENTQEIGLCAETPRLPSPSAPTNP
jgi:hypothetical protein